MFALLFVRVCVCVLDVCMDVCAGQLAICGAITVLTLLSNPSLLLLIVVLSALSFLTLQREEIRVGSVVLSGRNKLMALSGLCGVALFLFAGTTLFVLIGRLGTQSSGPLSSDGECVAHQHVCCCVYVCGMLPCVRWGRGVRDAGGIARDAARAAVGRG